MSTLPVSFDDVKAAAARIAGHVHRTPVMTSRTADAVAGARLFFKCETFQRVGAFKARGGISITVVAAHEYVPNAMTATNAVNPDDAILLRFIPCSPSSSPGTTGAAWLATDERTLDVPATNKVRHRT